MMRTSFSKVKTEGERIADHWGDFYGDDLIVQLENKEKTVLAERNKLNFNNSLETRKGDQKLTK